MTPDRPMKERPIYFNVSMKSTLKVIGGEVRMIRPYRTISAYTGHPLSLFFESVNMGVPKGIDRGVFLRYRPLGSAATIPLYRAAHRYGYLVVADMDDFPFFKEYRETDFFAFRGVHAVQVSTPALAEVIRPYNPEIRVVPNEVVDLPDLADKPRAPIRLFCGAVNRGAEWPALLPALRRVLADRPHVSVDVMWDRALFEALPEAQRHWHGMLPYDGYIDLLSAAHICLSPLSDTHFNRYKSDLKFVEAASRGTVFLASPTVYADSIEDGATGMIFRSPEEFEARLARLIDDHALRRRIATAAHGHVRRGRLLTPAHAADRVAWYRGLLDRKAELDAAVRAQVPWLFEPGGQPAWLEDSSRTR